MPTGPTVIPITVERGVGNPEFRRKPPVLVITIATPLTDFPPSQLRSAMALCRSTQPGAMGPPSLNMTGAGPDLFQMQGNLILSPAWNKPSAGESNLTSTDE